MLYLGRKSKPRPWPEHVDEPACSPAPEARAEFDEAFDWYEQRRPGLGVDFVAQIQEVFDRISTTPELYAQIFRDVRRGVVRRFPYSVFYKIESQQVVVLAVFHSNRDPKIWQARA